MTILSDGFYGSATALPEYNDLIAIEIPEGKLQYAEWQDKYGKFLEYRTIWVNEDKRRKGFGTKLMKELFKIAKKQGVEVYVRASTNGKDDPLGKFITSLGYKTTYEVIKGHLNPEDRSWLGDMVRFHNEKEQYRNAILGLTFKYE